MVRAPSGAVLEAGGRDGPDAQLNLACPQSMELVAQIRAFVWTVPHICPTLADVGFRLLVIFSPACLTG